METLIFIVYAALSYWAAGETIYANKIRIGTASNLFMSRLVYGCFLGIVIIPIAIIKKIIQR